LQRFMPVFKKKRKRGDTVLVVRSQKGKEKGGGEGKRGGKRIDSLQSQHLVVNISS